MTVAYLPVNTCALCASPARWRIGSRHRSCATHLTAVIAMAYAALQKPRGAA